MMMTDSTRKSWFTLLLGLCLWSFLFFTRVYWYTPWCAVNPTPCLQDHVNAFDQIAFHFGSVQADFWSNVVQNFTGVVVFIAPWLLFSRSVAAKETLLTATISFWNLALNELFHTITQRPRPLVFQGVFGDGANIHNYTSFYSGHTSFTALASLSFFFIMKRNYSSLSPSTKKGLIFVYLLLTITVATLRVVAGRHYPTDVIAGFAVGSLIALYFQKRS
jgi:membrane-associated phospholipid phosphatase